MPPDLLYALTSIRDELRLLRQSMSSLRRDVGLLLMWSKRGALIAGIWISAVWVNATADQKAAMVSAIIAALGG